MKAYPVRYLFKGIFSIGIIFFLTITVTAQIELTEQINYINHFSKTQSGNSTFTHPFVFIKPLGLKSDLRVSEKEKNKKAYSTVNLERKAFDLMNKKRISIGLKPVIWNSRIARIARIHSQSMAKNKFFSHQGLDGSWVNNRAKKNGVKGWKAISENIAYNKGYEDPAKFAVERWLKSTSHRKNALGKRWEESGVGVAIGADGKTIYFTQVFLDN